VSAQPWLRVLIALMTVVSQISSPRRDPPPEG